jgi:hypothetical protein
MVEAFFVFLGCHLARRSMGAFTLN